FSVRARRHLRAERRIVLLRREHDDDGVDLDAAVEIDRVLIGHADTAGRDRLADIFRLVGAVNTVQRVLVAGIKVHTAGAHRIVRTAGDKGRQWTEPFLLTGSRHPRRPFLQTTDLGDAAPGLRFFADGDAVADRLPFRQHVIEKLVVAID